MVVVAGSSLPLSQALLLEAVVLLECVDQSGDIVVPVPSTVAEFGG